MEFDPPKQKQTLMFAFPSRHPNPSQIARVLIMSLQQEGESMDFRLPGGVLEQLRVMDIDWQ